MGADYMMIPLMAADRFGVNSVARAMAVILPVNTNRPDVVSLPGLAPAPLEWADTRAR